MRKASNNIPTIDPQVWEHCLFTMLCHISFTKTNLTAQMTQWFKQLSHRFVLRWDVDGFKPTYKSVKSPTIYCIFLQQDRSFYVKKNTLTALQITCKPLTGFILTCLTRLINTKEISNDQCILNCLKINILYPHLTHYSLMLKIMWCWCRTTNKHTLQLYYVKSR